MVKCKDGCLMMVKFEGSGVSVSYKKAYPYLTLLGGIWRAWRKAEAETSGSFS